MIEGSTDEKDDWSRNVECLSETNDVSAYVLKMLEMKKTKILFMLKAVVGDFTDFI